MTLQETDRKEDEKEATVIVISRCGRTEETNLCKWGRGIPAKNPEEAKCSGRGGLGNG